MIYKDSHNRTYFLPKLFSGQFILEIDMFKFLWKPFFLIVFLFSFQAFAEDDPNPDSPTPILLSQSGSANILAVKTEDWDGKLPASGEKLFVPDEKNSITLFLTNVELLPKEGANAFRVYLYQKSGKTFELTTDDLIQMDRNIYALKVRLYDENGFRGQPKSDGVSLIFLTWRGLVSNALKISIGNTGGDFKFPAFLNSEPAKPIQQPATDYAGYLHSGDRIRFLEQATFGPTTALDTRIRRIGLRVWLAEQFEANYPTIAYPELPLMAGSPPPECSEMTFPSCYRERYTMQSIQQWFFKEAFYGDAQLRHRVSWALSQIWVTSGVSVQQSSHMIAYHKALSQNAFGNYRNLMRDVTLNPAMGKYLDMILSTRNNPNENYPREILQLFSIGLFKLNQDGSLQRDAQNNPIPTYTQETINNFAKVFTGWTTCEVTVQCPNRTQGAANFKDPLIINPANHDTTEKHLLDYPNAISQTIPACQTCTTAQATADYANNSLEQALNNIFNHPNLPPFISKLLIQQLVTSDPSPAYVERVANVFTNNGQNTRGDMKAVIKAILLDPEARGNIKTAPRYGKLREPVQLMTNLARIFPARSSNGENPSDGGLSTQLIKMGQNPFYSPTVFNYFPPDYIVPGTTLNAPEFALLNTSLGISRTNIVYQLSFERIPANATDSLRGTSLDLSEAVNAAADDATGNRLLDILNYKMMHGAMTAEHRNSVMSAVLAVPSTNALLRAKTAIYLISASAQYQIQR